MSLGSDMQPGLSGVVFSINAGDPSEAVACEWQPGALDRVAVKAYIESLRKRGYVVSLISPHKDPKTVTLRPIVDVFEEGSL